MQTVPARLLLLAAIGMPLTGQAANFVVSNTNDSGAGSLRQALLDANANGTAQADRIRKKIVETDNSSALPSVKTFVRETRATVNSDASNC